MPVFAATDIPTDPEPVPLDPDVTVIHEVLLAAVHAQLLVVVTDAVAEPPPTTTDADVGDTV